MNSISIQRLSEPSSLLDSAANLSFPFFRQSIRDQVESENSYIITAIDEVPIGLVYAQVAEATCTIFSIFVAPNYRKAGIAGQLLRRLDQELSHKKHVKQIVGTISSENQSFPMIQQLMKRNGWLEPAQRMHLYTLEDVQLDYATRPAFFHPKSLPDSHQIQSWSSIREHDLKKIRADVDHKLIPEYVDPLKSIQTIDPNLSKILLTNNIVCGWVTIHQINAHTRRLDLLFADSRYTQPGLGFTFLGHALQDVIAQYESKVYRKLTWGVAVGNPFLKHFQKRILSQVPGIRNAMSYYCLKKLQSS